MKLFLTVILAALLVFSVGCGNNSESNADYTPDTEIQDTIWLTVGSRVIRETEAKYFIYSSARMMTNHFPFIEWNHVIEGVPVPEFVKIEALNSMRLHYAIYTQAQIRDVMLDDEQISAYNRLIEGYLERLGGEQEFLAYLSEIGLSEALFSYLHKVEVLASNLIADAAASGELNGSSWNVLMMSWRDEVSYTLGEMWENADVREIYESLGY